MLLVITGPIASGKSTLARAVAHEFELQGLRAAAVDLDLIYEMLDPGRAAKADQAKWTQARGVAARLAAALLEDGVAVVIEGEFLTPADRAEFTEALPSGIEPRFVTLRVSYELAVQRAHEDPTRGLSRDPLFLRNHYESTAQAVRDAPSTDLAINTGELGIAEAVRVVTEWSRPA